MELEKFVSWRSFIRHELTVLLQGTVIALFFFLVTAIGSFSAINGKHYLELFEALMGHDYLVMGLLGYLPLIGLSGYRYKTPTLVAQSKVGWYARSILVFPFAGFIAPAVTFTIFNIFSTLMVSESINDKILVFWPIMAVAAVALYACLCSLPYIFGKLNLASHKVMYSLVIWSSLTLTLFNLENIFLGTTYAIYGFWAIVISILFLIFKKIARNRKRQSPQAKNLKS